MFIDIPKTQRWYLKADRRYELDSTVVSHKDRQLANDDKEAYIQLCYICIDKVMSPIQ